MASANVIRAAQTLTTMDNQSEPEGVDGVPTHSEPPLDVPEDVDGTIAILQRHRDGDREEFGVLYDRYRDSLMVVVRARTRGLKQSAKGVEDVVQDAFFKALGKLEKFEYRFKGAFLAWVSTIAVRDCIKLAQREAGRAVHIESQADEDRAPQLADADTSREGPARLAEQREHEELVLRGLDELGERNPDYRDIILSRDYLMKPFREVAEEFGLPSPDAAQMKHTRARVKLGKILEQLGLRPDARGGEREA